MSNDDNILKGYINTFNECLNNINQYSEEDIESILDFLVEYNTVYKDLLEFDREFDLNEDADKMCQTLIEKASSLNDKIKKKVTVDV